METRKFLLIGALIVVTALSSLGVLIGISCYSEWRVRRNLTEATQALEAKQKEEERETATQRDTQNRGDRFADHLDN